MSGLCKLDPGVLPGTEKSAGVSSRDLGELKWLSLKGVLSKLCGWGCVSSRLPCLKIPTCVFGAPGN